ncbi:MAG: GNAT family N-acetyltransferase [Myxococcota bacterium]
MDDINFRSATSADAEQVADIYLESRKTFLAYAPLVHSDDAIRQWIAGHLIPSGGVTVASTNDVLTLIVGMMALSRNESVGWIDQLYLRPTFVECGIGSHFVENAKAELGPPIQLHTFQENGGARRFYERQGFRILELGDGSGNEEDCPDILYEWA